MGNYFDDIDIATADTIHLNIQYLLATFPNREKWAEARAEMRRLWLSENELATTGNLPALIRSEAWFALAKWARGDTPEQTLVEELRATLARDFPAFGALEAKRKQPDYTDDEARAFAMLSYGGKYNLATSSEVSD